MEVISISGLPVINDDTVETFKTIADTTEITVHNKIPRFMSSEAQEKRKREISATLYRVFSKYV